MKLGFQAAPGVIAHTVGQVFWATVVGRIWERAGAARQSIRVGRGYLLALDRERETRPDSEPWPRVHLKASAGKLFCSAWKLPGK